MSILKILFLILFLAATPVSMVFAQWGATDNLLLFTSYRDGDEEIFKAKVTPLLALDEITQLTVNTDNDNRARLSPDGTKVAFIRNQTEIWMMDSQGDNQHFIHKGEDVGFSPDGNKLVFANEGSIYTSDLQAQKIFMVLANSKYIGYNRAPDWSPDGKKIIFQQRFVLATPRIFQNIAIINADSVYWGDKVNLTRNDEWNEGLAYSPRWSPDGTKIIYNCGDQACIMNADGSNDRNAFSLKIGGGFFDPVWSPDGGWIIFNLNYSSRSDFNGKQFAIKLDLSKAVTFNEANQPGNNYPSDWHGDPNAVFTLPPTPPTPPIPPTPNATVTLTASPATVNYQGSTTINWSSNNASYCSATTSDGWSGEIALSGIISIAPIATTTYTVSCTGNAGSSSQSVTVTVNSSADCLFNWAEANYPGLFSPAGAGSLDSSPYTYRYYKATNSYVGVSFSNNHVYYLGPDNVLQDVGGLPGWLVTAGCQ